MLCVYAKSSTCEKTKIMASSPITSWQIDGEAMEIVTDLIFLGSKITAEGDCNPEIKRHLLLGRKAMTNLNEGVSSQSYGFSVIMYECERWARKAER